MNKVFLIAKANLFNTFGMFGKFNIKSKTKKILATVAVTLALLSSFVFNFIFMAQMAIDFASTLVNGVSAEIAYLNLSIISATVIIFFSAVYSSQSYMFKSKDFDFLFSSPLSKKQVFFAKMISFYENNLAFSAITVIPIAIGYYSFFAFTVTSLLMFILTLILLPLLIVAVGAMIGYLFSWISTRTKYSTILNYVVLTAFIVFVFFLFNGGASFTGSPDLGRYNMSFWLGRVISNAIVNFTAIDVCTFIGLSLVAPVLITLIICPNYKKMVEKSNRTYKNEKSVNFEKTKSKNRLVTLFNKDVNNYFRTPIYVFNTFGGILIMGIMVVIASTQISASLPALMTMQEITNIMFPILLAMLCVACGISNTTCTSISLEGKQFWIIKSSPVSAMKFFISKILLCLMVSVPVSIITLLIPSIILGVSWYMFLLGCILIIAIDLLFSILGLFINMEFPKFDWTNETQVVKQGLSMLINMISCFLIVGAVGVLYYYVLSSFLTLFWFVVSFILLLVILDIVLLSLLNSRGTKKLNKLMAQN